MLAGQQWLLLVIYCNRIIVVQALVINVICVIVVVEGSSEVFHQTGVSARSSYIPLYISNHYMESAVEMCYCTTYTYANMWLA